MQIGLPLKGELNPKFVIFLGTFNLRSILHFSHVYVVMGKMRYIVVPNVPKHPRNISNPDVLPSPLKYLLAIKTNLSISILAYPKWSVLPTAVFTTDATSICGYSPTHTHSLSVSLLSCTLAPTFHFI